MGTVLMLLQLIPTILTAVRTVEDLIPLPGAGKAKLDLILGLVQDAYSGASRLLPAITAMIARIVEVFNTLGIFRKAPAA